MKPTYLVHLASCENVSGVRNYKETRNEENPVNGSLTNRQDDVDDVHQDQNQSSDASEVVDVGGMDEGDGQEMVSKHLPMVLPTLFDVQGNDLLEPKGPFGQHVSLCEGRKLSLGPISP